jgi:GntR family transcriptional repressor for pyruvate dehydrogenase complex
MNDIATPGVLERSRLSDTIYAALQDDIVGGKYSVGDRLPPENQLAQHFSVSRPVVREALRRLQSDGIIVSRQGSGTYVQRSPAKQVTTLTSSQKLRDALQGFEVRLSLEELAAKLAARNRSERDLADMERATEALRLAFASNVSRQAEMDADYAFHRAIVVASGNQLLLDVLDGVAERLKAGMHVTLSLTHDASEQRRARVLDEHDRVLKAIRVGDPDSAGIAMRYHIDQARNRLLDRQRDR